LTLVLAKCISLIVGDDKKIDTIKLATNPVFKNKVGNNGSLKSSESAVRLSSRDLKKHGKDSSTFSDNSVNLEQEELWRIDPSLSRHFFKGTSAIGQPKALKASLQEYSDHRNLILHRYPGYYLPDVDLGDISLPLPSLQLERQLSQFYTPNNPLDSSFSVQSHLEASRYAVFDPPLDEKEDSGSFTDVELPISLLEAEELFQKYLWESCAYIQVENAKRHAKKIEIWSFLKDVNCPIPDILVPEPLETNVNGLPEINQLYTVLENNLPQYITMLVRLLFYLNVSPNSDATSNSRTLNNLYTLSDIERAEEIVNRDAVRHKEIITHYISQILLDITKAAKRHRNFCPNQDILAFENVCILMVDNNAPILILKMLSAWFSNPNSSKGRKNTSADEVGDTDDTSIGTTWLQDRPLIDELK
jgi:hypothetical protein